MEYYLKFVELLGCIRSTEKNGGKKVVWYQTIPTTSWDDALQMNTLFESFVYNPLFCSGCIPGNTSWGI